MEPDEVVVAKMAREMSILGDCECHFSAPSMLRCVALLQLASRHPGLADDDHRFIDAFLSGAREFFAQCPTVLDVIRRGEES
jgi:hypothetical protein